MFKLKLKFALGVGDAQNEGAQGGSDHDPQRARRRPFVARGHRGHRRHDHRAQPAQIGRGDPHGRKGPEGGSLRHQAIEVGLIEGQFSMHFFMYTG